MRLLREGPTKITKLVIDSAWRRRATNQRLIIGDTDCRGLALVINASSASWTYSYKPRGLDPQTGKRFSSRAITIGNIQTHSVDAARHAAGVHKGAVKMGKDPADERKVEVKAKAEQRGRTLGRLFDLYAAALPDRPKLRGNGKMSGRHLAAEIAHTRMAIAEMQVASKAITELTADDLRALLLSCKDKPAAARNHFGAFSRFCDWALDEGYVKANPCLLLANARRPRTVAPRRRHLSLDELASIWNAAAGLQPVERDLVRFLIAVPCRRGEASKLRWSDLDLPNKVWSLSDKMTKNGDPHRLFLHPLALSILASREACGPVGKDDHVFPAPRSGKDVKTFSDIKVVLAEAVPEVTDWRLHDLRRSFATVIAEAGIPEVIADAVLNHRQSATRGGVLGVYQHAKHWPEQVKAMNCWGELLSAELGDRQPPSKVVNIAEFRS